MTDPAAWSAGSGPSPSLAEVLAAIEHPAARRRFRAAPDASVGPGWTVLGDELAPERIAARAAADPVASLGIGELTASMAFHALAVAPVDLLVAALVVADVVLTVDPGAVLLRHEGTGVAEAAIEAAVATPSGDDGTDRVAAALVDLLDPLAVGVVPLDVPARWGAVADLVAVLGSVRRRDHRLDVDRTWQAIDGVVDGLRARRPHPDERPVRLDGPAGPDGGQRLGLARRSTCCQWYRAARHLGEPSVADARCADCPSLDVATNLARLDALAAADGLARP